MSFAERLMVKVGSYVVPKRVAFRLARAVLATQGVGWAGPAGGMSGSGEARFLQRQLDGIATPVLFDVGANVGDYTASALLSNRQITVHCFEPSRSHFERLQARFSSPRVHLNHFGLSEREESLTLHKDADVTGLATLSQRDLRHLDLSFGIREEVQLMTGDGYVEHHGIARIDLMKIDVEGWEMPVLTGFRESFRKNLVCCCQFEFGHAHIERREHFRDFWQFFTGMGFRMGSLKPNGQVSFISRYDEIYENHYATNYVAVGNS